MYSYSEDWTLESIAKRLKSIKEEKHASLTIDTLALIKQLYERAYFKPSPIESISEGLKTGDKDFVELAIQFFEDDQIFHQSGRKKAKIARRLKHCNLTSIQKNRILDSLERRFLSGSFSDQYKDHLRLGMKLSPERMVEMALEGKKSKKQYIAKLSDWIITNLGENEPRRSI